MFLKPLLSVILATSLSACGTLQSRTQAAEKPRRLRPAEASRKTEPARARTTATEVAAIEAALAPDKMPPIPKPPKAGVEKQLRIPIDMNDRVEHWIKYFTIKDRERFQQFLNRGQPYKDVVESVLEENDLPAELYYLAMIESGYQTNAHSKAKAVGVWQFIEGTGHRYGLRIDSQVDERRDPIRATEAAAKYLRDLYNVFGSWHLAMAAYNTGEIRVLRALMKGRTRDFWKLIDAKTLPEETANYVPKFLAVVMIGKEPEKYGFHIKPAPSYPSLEAVEVPGSLPLKTIAEMSGVPLQTFTSVNPHLLGNATPSGSQPYEIWLPKEAKYAVDRVRGRLAKATLAPRGIAAVLPVRVSEPPVHVVKRGENLTMIAEKYKVSVGHLMRINNMTKSQLHVGSKLRTKAKSFQTSNIVKYKVRRGDNLTMISRKFKTSPNQIKVSNKLKRNQLYVGQVLKIVSTN